MTEKIYNLSEFYKDDDTLTDKSRARKVLFSVSVFHVLFIAGPFLFFAIWEKFYDHKPTPMQVSLINLSLEKSKSDEPPGNPPEPPKDDPKNVKKEEPQPEEEAAPEPPPVEPTKKAVVEPPVKMEKIKVPTEKPVPKPPDTPKKWEPKKPAEIKKSDTVVKGKAPTPKINATSLADKLKKIQSQCKVTSTNNTGAGVPGPTGNPNVSGNVAASYYDQVTLFLYDLWQQPSKSEVNNQQPSVTVHISIDASGNVKSVSIIKKSGIPAMDASVEALLAKIRTKPLPPPPQGADEFDALLGIDDN